jgi:hypothetical protein
MTLPHIINFVRHPACWEKRRPQAATAELGKHLKCNSIRFSILWEYHPVFGSINDVSDAAPAITNVLKVPA